MQLQLTDQEQSQLIWQEGDFFEIIPGNITFTQIEQDAPNPQLPNAPVFTHARFFFDSLDPRWGDQEWGMYIGNEVPNGPALLVLLRRGTNANAFGIVSMSNRAWTHALNMLSMPIYKDSTGAKELGQRRTMFWIGFAVLVVVGTMTGIACLALPALMFVPSVREKVKGLMFSKNPDEIAKAARGLMYRLSKSADQYWPADGGLSGNAESGRL